ncbi:MAG: alpha/beta hydrolase [Halanaerobiales bacterium]
MNISDFSLEGTAGIKIYGTKYSVESPRGVLLIVHGMAEHRQRYYDFARHLNHNGYIVYTYDHRGHGETAVKNNQTLGYFARKDGWEKIIKDLHKLLNYVIEKNKGLPVFLLGHSMGSFIVRNYIAHYGERLTGVILSGAGEVHPWKLKLIKPLVKLEKLIRGSESRSKVVQKLIFSSNNRQFKPSRTDYDWLSRDNEVVDNYIMDRFCGFKCTTGFYEDFIKGIFKTTKWKSYSSVPNTLSLLFIAGGQDPVGGEDIKEIAENYREAGVWDVVCKVYPNARHELLNEINKKEVFSDLTDWLKERTSALEIKS